MQVSVNAQSVQLLFDERTDALDDLEIVLVTRLSGSEHLEIDGLRTFLNPLEFLLLLDFLGGRLLFSLLSSGSSGGFSSLLFSSLCFLGSLLFSGLGFLGSLCFSVGLCLGFLGSLCVSVLGLASLQPLLPWQPLRQRRLVPWLPWQPLRQRRLVPWLL